MASMRPRRATRPSYKIRENQAQQAEGLIGREDDDSTRSPSPHPTSSFQPNLPLGQEVSSQASSTLADSSQPSSSLPLPSPSWAMVFNSSTRRQQQLLWNHSCRFCSTLLLSTESNGWCCRQGKSRLDPLPIYPSTWTSLFYNTIPHGARDPSRYLNNVFAMSALGVTGKFMYPSGLSNVVITGRTYHRLLDLQSGHHSLRWFIYDAQGHYAAAASHGLPSSWVSIIKEGLALHNPFVQQVRVAAERATGPSFMVELDAPVASQELAAIVNTNNLLRVNPRKVVYWSRGDDGHQYLSILSPYYEPLQYPLLFPHGTLGWGVGNAYGLTQLQWYRYRILTEDRFRCLTRLAQEYMVDMYSRVEEHRIQFIQRAKRNPFSHRLGSFNQANQGGHEGDEHEDEDNGGIEGSWKTSLPSSFLGSRAWCSAQVSDALALCRHFGRPSLFITMTTNPNWPEILDQLLPGQTAADQPQTVVRVFHAKMAKLIQLLQSASGGFLYFIYVIEFQKRGLPHCHLLVKLKHELPFSHLDDLVKAELPCPIQDPDLHRIITTCNIHPASHLEASTSRCNRGGKCVYGFPQPIQETTTLDEFGRVHLRRRHERDQWVVSYIPALSRVLACHIHVDICSNVAVVMYLYKYLFKGVDHAHARTTSTTTSSSSSSTIPNHNQTSSSSTLGVSTSSNEQYNEIEDYVNCRYLSSSEAMWRIFSYSITRKNPGITRLTFHLPDQQFPRLTVQQERLSTATTLLYYFARPLDPLFTPLRYTDYFSTYVRKAHLSDVERLQPHWQELPVPGSSISPYWVVARKKQDHVVRLKMISPKLGELYYLRHLLLTKPARSFAELRLVDGVDHVTFQEAALALGLFQNEQEAELAFAEAVAHHYSPQHLRFLLVQLLHDVPTPALTIWEKYKDVMTLDFADLHQATQRENRALQDIQRMLATRGATLAQHNLPPVISIPKELEWEWEQLALGRAQDEALYTRSRECFTTEQEELFQHLVAQLDVEWPRPQFIDGRAGRGKSFLLEAFVAYCRLQDRLVVVAGSTALSVLRYPRGRTAHSTFGIPVAVNPTELTSKVSPNSNRWQFLAAADLIIWEELPMINRSAFECARELMQAMVTIDEEPPPASFFGKALFIGTGDFRQVAPVVKGGGPQEILLASMKSAEYWPLFEIHSLQQPMRSGQDPDFTKWLDALGEGRVPTLPERPGMVSLEHFSRVSTIEDAVDFLFPPEVIQDPHHCINRAILSSLNKDVDDHNAHLLEQLDAPSQSLFACNWLNEADSDLHTLQTAAIEDYLASIQEAGVPAHELQLKPGAVCLLMRNLSLEKGLVKNTRVVVKQINRYSILVEVLSATNEQHCRQQLLPRINFEFIPQWTNYTVCRRQFPLRLAYATTFNSCQGLTLERAVIDLSIQPFTHGQLYTAFSRLRKQEDVRVLDTTLEEGLPMAGKNIVWSELLI